jgi:hypothetical protein
MMGAASFSSSVEYHAVWLEYLFKLSKRFDNPAH